MSLRDTSSRAAFNYTTHVHSAFNREAATQQTALATLAAILDLSGGGGNIDISTLAKENTLVAVKNALEGTLDVNVVDISGLALEATQADLLTLAERQDLDGVKINADHPALTSYDFTNNHVLMTMLGPTTQDFRWNIDNKYNRDGWTFSTGNGQVLGSNCYWYANGAGTGNQTDLLYQDFTSWYTIVTIDNTDDVENAPFIGAYSPPTGTNDIIPLFAHSRWTFALPGGTQLFQNEQVLLYFGEIPKVHSDLRHLPLSLVSIGNNGDRAPTEKIYLITINTASGLAVGAVNYMLQGAGFVAKDVGREYYFSNSLERKQLANLSAASIPVSGTFYQATQPVSIADAVDVSGSVTVVNFPAVQDVSNGNLNSLSFLTDKGINYLNTNIIGVPVANDLVKVGIYDTVGSQISTLNPLPIKIMGTPSTIFAWTLANFTPNNGSIGSVSPAIQSDLYNSLTAFGTSTHSGGTGANPDLTYQYSLDDITYYNTPFEITLPNATVFSNTQSLGAPYVRFIVTTHSIDTLTLNVAVK